MNSRARYLENLAEARASVRRLMGLLDLHALEAEARPHDWGHVGDMAKISVELLALVEFMTREEGE